MIALVLIVIVVFLGFTKHIPFTRPTRSRRSSLGQLVRPNSPVRIAGVEVGKVTEDRAPGGLDGTRS